MTTYELYVSALFLRFLVYIFLCMVFITFSKLFYIFPFIFLSCIKITAPHEKHFLLRSLASLVSMPEPCWILASRLEGNLIGEKKSISLINSFHFNFSWFCSHACRFVSRLSLSPRYYFSLLFIIIHYSLLFHYYLNVFFVNQNNVSWKITLIGKLEQSFLGSITRSSGHWCGISVTNLDYRHATLF